MTGSADRVLVTGAAGFVGSHVVDALLARGVTVRALVRSTSDLSFLDRARVELAHGDVGDDSADATAGLAAACAGCSVVYHVAGITQARALDDYGRVNADGTGRVARAAADGGVRRLVYVSSQAAAGPSEAGRPRVEGDPEQPLSAYGRSKLEGERRARAVAGTAGTELVIVRPPSVYGPRDRAFLTLFRLVNSGFAPLPGSPRQELSLVHARDLARGIVQAGEGAAAGTTWYLTDGVPVTTGELVERIARALAKKPLRVAVPSGILRVAVAAAEAWSKVSGRTPRLTRERLHEWTAPCWTLSDARARRELGYASEIPLATGIEGTASWYRTAGWI